jgi:hypothetical protein
MPAEVMLFWNANGREWLREWLREWARRLAGVPVEVMLFGTRMGANGYANGREGWRGDAFWSANGCEWTRRASGDAYAGLLVHR